MTRLLLVPGDGIGPEVIGAARTLLETLAPSIELTEATAGRQALEAHGEVLSPELTTLLESEPVDGVLFGATETRPGEASAVLALRQATGARCSIRPAVSLPGAQRAVDVTVYRELTEGLYVQWEEPISDGTVAQRPITETATERFAELALPQLDPGVPTVIAHKATVLPGTDGLFLETLRRAAAAYDLEVEDRLVDALAHDLALDATGPLQILAPNLYGDILSDLTAGLAGGLGTAPSLTLGDGAPIAEPVHGTAPDLVGTGHANPTATFLSLSMLLDHLGHTGPAQAITTAAQHALEDPAHRTPDLGGSATTDEMSQAVLRLATDEVVA